MAGGVKCQKSKVDRHSKQTRLISMPTGERPFEKIAIDFVAQLLETGGFNAILVVTDQFTKVKYYTLAKTSWTVEDVADSYSNEIWRLYSLPRYICLDRGPQFASKCLKEMNRKLNINLCHSTTYHIQTDEISE